MSKKRSSAEYASITAQSCTIVSAANIAAIGIVHKTRKRPMSVPIRIGRRRMRSTQTPANRPSTRVGTIRAADRMPIWKGVALSAMTAAKPIATSPIRVPNIETVSPVHSFMKSAWRKSPPRRRTCGAD